MKAKDIEEILNNGGRLIFKNNAYFNDWYFIGEEKVENRITITQFEKYKATCKNSDESDKINCNFRGQSYRLYYWR